MKPTHWIALGMFLTGLATQMAAMHTWAEATSPTFVAGIVLNVGGVLTALFSDKPRAADAQTRTGDPSKELP